MYQLRKESLNSDGRQFHQYLYIKQSSLILTHSTQKKKHDHSIGNPVPGLGQTQTFGRVNTVNIMIKLEKPRLPYE